MKRVRLDVVFGVAAFLLAGCSGSAVAAEPEGHEGADSRGIATRSSSLRKLPAVSSPRLSRLRSLARVDLETGRWADAYHRLRPNVAEARGDTEYLALLALAAMRLGSYGEALVIYESLAREEPISVRWRVGMALAREQLGLDAAASYREALALSEGFEEIRELLRVKLGESPDADVG